MMLFGHAMLMPTWVHCHGKYVSVNFARSKACFTCPFSQKVHELLQELGQSAKT